MKEYDRVRLIRERSDYTKVGVKVGDEGIILGPKRLGYWLVLFDGEIGLQDENGVYYTTEIDVGVLEEGSYSFRQRNRGNINAVNFS
ncbi:MAG: DUF3148 domain-containing protein [Roseburia sp.]|nr:DUF3148 domain-containing protein [Roseburia sp.]